MTGVIAGLIIVLASGAVAWIGRLGAHGKLPRQHWAGIRVPSTLATDAAWYAAHRAGARPMLLGGLAGVLVGAIATVVSGFGLTSAGLVLVGVAAIVMFAGVLGGTILGIKAAHRV